MKTVLSQNYCTFSDYIYQLPKGIAMGSSVSSIIAKIVIQHCENTFIKNLFEFKKKRFNSTYVDGILVMYDKSMIAVDLLTSNMICKHKNIIFKSPPKNKKHMNFLDLILIQKEFYLEVDVYRKTPTIDTTINSFHITP